MPKRKATKAQPKASRKGWLTRRQLAQALGCGPRSVEKWLEEGMPVAQRGRGGRPSLYSEHDVAEWLEARNGAAASSAPGGGGPLNPAQEKARRDHWQSVLAEQTYRTRKGELLPAAEAEKRWSAEVGAARAKFLSLPTTLPDRLHRAAVLEGVRGVERLLREAIHEVLRELSGEKTAAA